MAAPQLHPTDCLNATAEPNQPKYMEVSIYVLYGSLNYYLALKFDFSVIRKTCGTSCGQVVFTCSSDKLVRIPLVGETVLVPSLYKEAVVLEILSSKGEILVQAGGMKLRLKLKDIVVRV
ncbi:hypothetical protein KSP40_PGU005972 [Platanthera guangdongensis]|uniref:MutS2 and Smr-associated SH3 domain-containing protein n=1 Tax=Platanthera guangdongensis TaxID=2320717 RepID=A0ABR2MHR1_9ASPA